MYDAPTESPKDAAAQQNPYWPIGVLAEARKQFNEQDFQKVVTLLHPAVADQTASPAAVALYGRAAVESQNTAAFQWWLSQTDDQTRELSDYWAAVGAHLLDERRFEEATRALAEAIDRDPTDLASMSRIRKSLATLGKDDMAKLWVDRWTAVYDLVVANNRVSSSQPPNTDAIAEMVAMMSGLDRPLEALLWKSLQIHYEHAPRSEMEALNAQRKTLLASGQPFQLVGTDTERDSIGAKVSVICGQTKWNGWVIAGDGYLCRNENVVSFGLGQTETIDKITVDWPSGSQQVFENLQPDRRLLITENEAEPFTLFETPR